MKVILCENVPNLGDMGTTVKVADGYARNYLLPRKLAVAVASGSAKEIEHQKALIARREEKVRAELGQEAKQLEGLTVEIKVRAGENERIFGSVTTANIAQRLKEMGHDFDRKQIILEEPIKTLGIFSVPLRLMKGVEAEIKVWVASDQPVEITAEPEEAVVEETPAVEETAAVEEAAPEATEESQSASEE